MEQYRIQGGNRLHGEIEISGAKNAAVAIIPAALLVNGVCRIENLPEEEVKSIPVVHVERELTTQEKIQKYIPFAVMGVAVLFLIALLIPSKKDEHRSKESGEADDENKTN